VNSGQSLEFPQHKLQFINQTTSKETILKKIVKFLRIIIILLSIFLILFKIIDIDKIVMKKIYPLKYTEYVEKYSKEYNIDSYMI